LGRAPQKIILTDEERREVVADIGLDCTPSRLILPSELKFRLPTRGAAGGRLSLDLFGDCSIMCQLNACFSPLELFTDKEKAAKITAILEKQDERVIYFSTSGFLRFAPDKTVAQTRAEFAQAAKRNVEITYIYVIDERDRLLGVVDSKALLVAEETTRLREIMNTKVVTLRPQSTLRNASELFARYLYRALPVTDEDGKIRGVLPYRDVVALRHRYVE
jgi:CBS domain-containing protein